MAAFVDGQEHFMHLIQDEHQTYAMSGQIRKGKDIDLGPLVGRTRGFRTKERVPMSGGLGGMEMDEVPAVRIESPVPQKRSGKGKERAVDGDVEMSDDVEERRGRSRETKSLYFILFSRSRWSLILFYFVFRTEIATH